MNTVHLVFDELREWAQPQWRGAGISVDCARKWRGRDDSHSGRHSAACSLVFSPHIHFSSVLCDSTADNSSWLQRGTGTGTGTGTGIGTINARLLRRYPLPRRLVSACFISQECHYDTFVFFFRRQRIRKTFEERVQFKNHISHRQLLCLIRQGLQ